MRYLKQSTTVTVTVGPICYATAQAIPVASFDVTTLTCAISKHGATPVGLSLTASGGDNDLIDAASMPGWYELELQPTDVGTIGHFRVMIDNAVIFPFQEDFNIVCSDFWTLIGTDGTIASADAVVDAWEVQSQADPTGFHVNLLEINGAAQVSGGVTIATAGVDAVWDEVLHDTKTARQLLGILLPAFAAGKATGGGTGSITFRDTGDGFDAIVQTVDENGNRSTVTVAFA